MKDAKEFDWIAENIFAPIYPVIAADALRETGIRSGRMLDIGSGGGHLGLAVLEAAPGLSGILLDCNPGAVELAEHRIAARGLRGRAIALVGDVQCIPLASGSVDLIVSRGSTPFWEDYRLAYSEILRVLTPEGRAYIGGGLGNAKLAAEIAEKMKVVEPGWPNNIPFRTNGRRKEETMEILDALHAEYEILEDPESGKWTLLCGGKMKECDTE